MRRQTWPPNGVRLMLPSCSKARVLQTVVALAVSEGWFDWLALSDLFPVVFPGAKTNRDSFLVDFDILTGPQRRNK